MFAALLTEFPAQFRRQSQASKNIGNAINVCMNNGSFTDTTGFQLWGILFHRDLSDDRFTQH
ncbi:hypothetical protein A6A40_23865 (plasmid) [Azospirillum humicireducens]|uniref:Uncharacterized protein n=1 Tax=Azospirillum humicireducens TaxID=1226968 RepID=A0A2R4VUF9_9PROT|nr:hypothetical protein A6A40_23865 [Azospirillum humicireducens]